MMRHGGFASAAVLALAVAACGGSADAPTVTDGDAQGEVQGGSISDAMLATDAVKSQSPSLKPSPTETGGGGNAGQEGPEEAAEPVAPAEAAAPEEPAEEG
ncbi:hypothetical protein [Parerythrobacter aestuarii]|uniref:hypothetical protein n=1 Tax=Parerythrobacter aestuarii TaxID=3020909 RepID=UPI0024DEDCBF|nr:hypothetical protein [Parerythrobacter aestuarii]